MVRGESSRRGSASRFTSARKRFNAKAGSYIPRNEIQKRDINTNRMGTQERMQYTNALQEHGFDLGGATPWSTQKVATKGRRVRRAQSNLEANVDDGGLRRRGQQFGIGGQTEADEIREMGYSTHVRNKEDLRDVYSEISVLRRLEHGEGRLEEAEKQGIERDIISSFTLTRGDRRTIAGEGGVPAVGFSKRLANVGQAEELDNDYDRIDADTADVFYTARDYAKFQKRTKDKKPEDFEEDPTCALSDEQREVLKNMNMYHNVEQILAPLVTNRFTNKKRSRGGTFIDLSKLKNDMRIAGATYKSMRARRVMMFELAQCFAVLVCGSHVKAEKPKTLDPDVVQSHEWSQGHFNVQYYFYALSDTIKDRKDPERVVHLRDVQGIDERGQPRSISSSSEDRRRHRHRHKHKHRRKNRKT